MYHGEVEISDIQISIPNILSGKIQTGTNGALLLATLGAATEADLVLPLLEVSHQSGVTWVRDTWDIAEVTTHTLEVTLTEGAAAM